MTLMNNNKNILAIETSSNVCGMSYIEKGSCVGCLEEDISKKHAEILPEFYLNLQKKTDFILDNMDAIAVSIGPGSFTGLRIGLSFAKGLAFSKDLPIIPISTMMSLAYTLKEELPLIGIIHSHAKRVFCQKIRWDQRIPYPDGDIRVAEWEELLEEIDYSKKTFQLNCDSLKKGSFFINSKLSSTSVGLLAGINFEKLVIDKPFDLVPNYVSPFMVGKKK